jgi:hypothetical protein
VKSIGRPAEVLVTDSRNKKNKEKQVAERLPVEAGQIFTVTTPDSASKAIW